MVHNNQIKHTNRFSMNKTRLREQYTKCEKKQRYREGEKALRAFKVFMGYYQNNEGSTL